MILVGSSILFKEFPSLQGVRPKRDTDFLISKQEFDARWQYLARGAEILVKTDTRLVTERSGGLITEINTPRYASDYDLLDMFEQVGRVNLQALLAMKMSHRYKKDCPHFWKTRNDILFLRKNGIELQGFWREFAKDRELETIQYQHPKLNVTKEGFFKGDGVDYVYDHDSIHEAIALGEKPAYKSYMVDGEEVLTSKEKFDKLPFQTRLNGVYEEVCVLALERSQIPFSFAPNVKASFGKALEKVCTSITSGWFREFAWDNAHLVVAMAERMNYNYVKMFKENSDKLKPYIKNSYQ